MATTQSDSPGLGSDAWSLFLRQRRLKDQLRRLRNDLKHCYCPAGCRGEPQNHVAAGPGDLPAQPLHAPHVPVDSDLPGTWSRPRALRVPNSPALAEARGTSDILLHRAGTRATLRMSMQVLSDPALAGRIGYYGEMFLTQQGRQEEFIGYIQSWYVDRRRRPDEAFWEEMYLDRYGTPFEYHNLAENDLGAHRTYLRLLFGDQDDILELADRDHNGNILPCRAYRNHFAAAWAGLSEGTDIVYIPLIWIDESFTGQRIIDQGFELFFRLMTGGSLPELGMEAYNITRPFGALLEVGEIEGPLESDWQMNGRSMTLFERRRIIASAYERNGFMRFGPGSRYDFNLGRRVDPADYTAAPGDMAIVPPNPSRTDLDTPSPERSRRQRLFDARVWPEKRGRRLDGTTVDDDDDDDEDDDETQPRNRPATGTGMGYGKPPVTPRGGRGGRPTTPRGPRGNRFGTPRRPTTGGLSLTPAKILFP